jgi:DNA-binding transcriptional ArsR family regulator
MSPAEPAADPPEMASVEVLTVLQALSDPVRLDMVRQLARCPAADGLSCGQIEVPVGKSTATHHLKVLLASGLTVEREAGNRKYVKLRRDELEARFPGLLDLVLDGRA